MLEVKIYRAWDIRTARQIQIYSLKRVGSPEMVPKNLKTKKVKAVTKETSKKYRTRHLCNRNYCRWAETGEHQLYTVSDSEFWHFSFTTRRLDSKSRVQSVLNGFAPYSGRLIHNYSLNTRNDKSHDPGGNNGNNSLMNLLIL